MSRQRATRFKPKQRVPVGFLGPQARFVGGMANISESGVLVQTQHTINLGMMGRLGFDLGSETFRTVAVVRRTEPGVGVAFEFIHMSPHNRELLHRFLSVLSKQAAP